jgi:hypothetical protein
LQKDLELLQTKWKAVLDPVLKNPLTNITILQNVILYSGDNQVSHRLGRMQQGWVLLDVQGPATLYRYQPFTETYLYLNSSANVTVSLGVF